MNAGKANFATAISLSWRIIFAMAAAISLPAIAGPPQDFTPVDIANLPESKARNILMFRACDANHDHELTKPEVEGCGHPRAVPLRASWENNLNNSLSEKELLDMQQYAQGWVETWAAEYKKGNASVFRIYQSTAVLGMIAESMLPMTAETRRPWAKVSAADVARMVRFKYGVDIPDDLVSLIPEVGAEPVSRPISIAAEEKPVAQPSQRQSPMITPGRKHIQPRMKRPECVIKPVMTNAEIEACR